MRRRPADDRPPSPSSRPRGRPGEYRYSHHALDPPALSPSIGGPSGSSFSQPSESRQVDSAPRSTLRHPGGSRGGDRRLPHTRFSHRRGGDIPLRRRRGGGGDDEPPEYALASRPLVMAPPPPSPAAASFATPPSPSAHHRHLPRRYDSDDDRTSQVAQVEDQLTFPTRARDVEMRPIEISPFEESVPVPTHDVEMRPIEILSSPDVTDLRELLSRIMFEDKPLVPHPESRFIRLRLELSDLGGVYRWRPRRSDNYVLFWSLEFVGSLSDPEKLRLRSDVETLREKAHHSNLIDIFGISLTYPFGLITEVLECDVLSLIHGVEEQKVTEQEVTDGDRVVIMAFRSWSTKLKICCQVARAIRHLHEFGMVHRNLAWSNVLVSDVTAMSKSQRRWKVVVCGLGQLDWVRLSYSKPKKTSKSTSDVGHLAPEVNEDFTDRFEASADVFAFGVMLYELFGEKSDAYDGRLPSSSIAGGRDAAARLIRGKTALRPNVRTLQPLLLPADQKWVLDLMQSCWDADPVKRPTFEAIVPIFENWRSRYDDSHPSAVVAPRASLPSAHIFGSCTLAAECIQFLQVQLGVYGPKGRQHSIDDYFNRDKSKCFCQVCARQRQSQRGGRPAAQFEMVAGSKAMTPFGWVRFAVPESRSAISRGAYEWPKAFHGVSAQHALETITGGAALILGEQFTSGPGKRICLREFYSEEHECFVPLRHYNPETDRNDGEYVYGPCGFVTPSLLYASNLDFAPSVASEGKTFQVVFLVRMQPNTEKVRSFYPHQEMIGAPKGKKLDLHFANEEIEWWTYLEDVAIVTDLLVRKIDRVDCIDFIDCKIRALDTPEAHSHALTHRHMCLYLGECQKKDICPDKHEPTLPNCENYDDDNCPNFDADHRASFAHRAMPAILFPCVFGVMCPDYVQYLRKRSFDRTHMARYRHEPRSSPE